MATSASTRAPTLATIDDEAFDAVVANYVVMDVPDLTATMAAFSRVLRPDGIAVLIFSHPCFPQGADGRPLPRRHRLPLAVPLLRAAPLHRPAVEALHVALRLLPPAALGLLEGLPRRRVRVVDFEEPRIAPDRHAMAESPRQLANCQTRPYSVAFKLRKPAR